LWRKGPRPETVAVTSLPRPRATGARSGVREADPVDAPLLPDGSYDAIVVDAREVDEATTALELTILAGPQKGQVVELRGPRRAHDPIDLLGVPATITVTDGTPHLRLEG